jgi:hypothetical protein
VHHSRRFGPGVQFGPRVQLHVQLRMLFRVRVLCVLCGPPMLGVLCVLRVLGL